MLTRLKKLIEVLPQSLATLVPTRPEKDPSSALFPAFIKRVHAVTPKARILEIGSRNVTGNPIRGHFAGLDYVGMDILPGENVDVVGDAHKLSELFEPESFDAIVTAAVFEHLFFPWKVAIEMNRVLKPGGRVFVATHPAWQPHELPWDFWRFPENGMRALFNKATGFEVVDVKEGLPARLVPLVWSLSYLSPMFFNVHLSIAMEAVKVGQVDQRVRWDIPVDEITDTMYPSPKAR